MQTRLEIQDDQALAKFEQSLPLVNFDPLTDELLAYSGAGQNEKVIALLQKAYELMERT